MSDFLTPRSEAVPGLSQDDKTWGMLAHISSLAGLVVPLGNVIAPLVVWLIKKDASQFVNDQGKESLNFQISVAIYAFGGLILAIITAGILFFVPMLVALAGAVFAVIAGVKSNGGEAYRYPATIRLIK